MVSAFQALNPDRGKCHPFCPQATSTDPSAPLRFSVSAYFVCFAGVMAMATVALVYLQRELRSRSPLPLLLPKLRLDCGTADATRLLSAGAPGAAEAAAAASSPLLACGGMGRSRSDHVASPGDGDGGHSGDGDGVRSSSSSNNDNGDSGNNDADACNEEACDAQGAAWAALLGGRCLTGAAAEATGNAKEDDDDEPGSSRRFRSSRSSSSSSSTSGGSGKVERWLRRRWAVRTPAGRLFLGQVTKKPRLL
jgi:hypothetical protein